MQKKIKQAKKIFYCFLFVLFPIVSFSQNLEIRNFSYTHGLNASEIFCIKQDSRGFIWLGTTNGLFRYDGYSFVNYKFSNKHISFGTVNSIEEESYGQLWICTERNGIFVYNYFDDTVLKVNLTNLPQRSCWGFYFYKDMIFIKTKFGILQLKKPEKKYTGEVLSVNEITFNYGFLLKFQSNSINSIFAETYQGQEILWVGTNGALFQYNLKTKKSEYVNTSPNNSIYDLQNYNEDTLISGSWERGIFLIDKKTKQKTQNKITNYINSIVARMNVVCILLDNNKIWIGTNGNGAFLFENSKGKLSNVALKNEGSLSERIYCIYKDKEGIVWTGGDNTALSQVYQPKPNLQLNEFISGKNELKEIKRIAYTEKSDFIWIGTEKDGIFCMSKDFKVIANISSKNQGGIKLPDDNITQIFLDKSENLWFTTKYTGLFFIPANALKKISNGEKTELHAPISAGKNILNSGELDRYTMSMFQDSKNRIWIGSWGTIYRIDILKDLSSVSNENEFYQAIKAKCVLSEIDNGVLNPYFSPVMTFEEDSKGKIWMGTKRDGLLIYTETTSGNFTLTKIKTTDGLINDNITKIKRDKQNKIWVTTYSGVSLLNENCTIDKNISLENNNLISNYLNNVILDNLGNVWLSSPIGVYCIEKENIDLVKYRNLTFGKNFIPIDGFCSENKMVFIGKNSYIELPVKYNEKHQDIPLFISAIRINNEKVFANNEIDGTKVLEFDINHCKKITVPYNKLISIEFGALDFLSSNSLLYKYKIDASKEWVFLNANQRNILLSNLQTGKHKIYLKAANNQAIWNESTYVLSIEILPPFYLTTLAKIVYLLLGIVVFLVIRKFVLTRIQEKHALEKERFERVKVEELNQLKISFFTNISHEIRTPLTLIINPIEKITHEKSLPEHLKNIMQIVEKNSQRLLRLVNELMDFSKIEHQKLKPRTKNIEFTTFVYDICKLFEYQANNQDINFEVKSKIDELILAIDSQMMEKVIFNLLSNAFKYTMEQGNIELSIETVKKESLNKTKTEFIKLTIKNDGKTIPVDKLSRIFDRYYQVDNMQPEGKTGTGIGLALVKDYVELHSGYIEAISNLEKGTCFSIYLPIIKKTEESSEEQIDFKDNKVNSLYNNELASIKPTKKYKILIVEDNAEIREYVALELREEYAVLMAENGEVAMEKALEVIPDLIITDIIMPKMNGLQLCKVLKNNLATSHIPIIALSAKAEMENQIEGLMQGADVYIVKPFNIHHLKVQILRLIQFKEKVYSRFSQEIEPLPVDSVQNPLDVEFMNTIIQFIEKNLDNSELDMELISKHVRLSKSQTYRKLKAISGVSPVEFLRGVRLKKAALLIKKGGLTFSEIAYMCGFSTPSYFTRSFRDHFGKSPTEYAEEN